MLVLNNPRQLHKGDLVYIFHDTISVTSQLVDSAECTWMFQHVKLREIGAENYFPLEERLE
jgi:hypothetical protein